MDTFTGRWWDGSGYVALREIVIRIRSHGSSSSSNFLIPNIISQYLERFDNFHIPNFSDTDTIELLETYKAPSELLEIAKFINSFADNHPSLIIATINYFESAEWKIDFGKFLSNKFIDNELQNFQILLEKTVTDVKTRELAYRLNNIG